MNLDLAGILNEARRQALLTGKPFTDQETLGLTNAWRNAQSGLANEQRQNQLAQDQLAQSRWATQAQIDAAQKAQNTQLFGNLINTGGSALGMDWLKNKQAGTPNNSLVSQGWSGAKELFNNGIDKIENTFGFGSSAPPSGVATISPIKDFAMNGAKDALTPALGQATETGAGAGAGAGVGSLIPSGSTPALSMAPELAKDLGTEVAPQIGSVLPETSFAMDGNAQALSSALSNATAAPTAGLSAYLGPAGWGFAAPGLANSIQKDATENLGHNLSLGLVQNEKAADAIGSTAVGGLGGAIAAGAAAGSIVPGFGNVVGGLVGAAAGLASSLFKDTWICTATAKHSRVKKTEEAVMKKLRIYARENHPGWWNSYFKNGTHLVGEIAQQESDLPKFYDNIRKILIEPVIKTFDKDPEEAFQIYLFITQTLFKAYMPEFVFKEIE